MAFDFPPSPTNGQLFTPPGGPTYIWQPPAWLSTTAAGTSVAEGPPSSPVAGQMWWESDTGNLYVWYVDGTSSQWVQCNAASPADPNVGKTAESRNRIVNPAMQISQENGNTAISSNGYAADQWASFNSSAAIVYSQRFQVATPNRSVNRVRYTVSPADAALAVGDLFQVYQFIEGIRVADFGWGAVGAKQVVLRFGWRSPAGTYGVSIKNGANNRTWLATFTISAGQAGTDTEQIFVVPGDTTGAWTTDATAGLMLTFGIAGGTTYQGVAGWQAGNFMVTAACTNGLAVNLNAFDVFDVGLYLDPLGTNLPPPWQMPDEAEELRACQRYYCKTFPRAVNPAQNVGMSHNPFALNQYTSVIGNGTDYSVWQFQTEMRAIPTIVTYSPGFANANWWDAANSAGRSISAIVIAATQVMVGVTGYVAGGSNYIHITANARM